MTDYCLLLRRGAKTCKAWPVFNGSLHISASCCIIIMWEHVWGVYLLTFFWAGCHMGSKFLSECKRCCCIHQDNWAAVSHLAKAEIKTWLVRRVGDKGISSLCLFLVVCCRSSLLSSLPGFGLSLPVPWPRVHLWLHGFLDSSLLSLPVLHHTL